MEYFIFSRISIYRPRELWKISLCNILLLYNIDFYANIYIHIKFGMLFNCKIIGNLFQRGYIVTTSLNIDFYANSRQSVFDFNAIHPRLIF